MVSMYEENSLLQEIDNKMIEKNYISSREL